MAIVSRRKQHLIAWWTLGSLTAGVLFGFLSGFGVIAIPGLLGLNLAVVGVATGFMVFGGSLLGGLGILGFSLILDKVFGYPKAASYGVKGILIASLLVASILGALASGGLLVLPAALAWASTAFFGPVLGYLALGVQLSMGLSALGIITATAGKFFGEYLPQKLYLLKFRNSPLLAHLNPRDNHPRKTSQTTANTPRSPAIAHSTARAKPHQTSEATGNVSQDKTPPLCSRTSPNATKYSSPPRYSCC